jgi:hypothetical protein
MRRTLSSLTIRMYCSDRKTSKRKMTAAFHRMDDIHPRFALEAGKVRILALALRIYGNLTYLDQFQEENL